MLAAAIQGWAVWMALILIIGAQNAFVLRQGVKRDRVALTVVACIICDSTLLVVGALGVGTVVAGTPWLHELALWGGVAFLAVYGGKAAWDAVKPGRTGQDPTGDGVPGASGAGAIVCTALALTLLNPHAWLDAAVIMGSVGADHELAARAAFTGGAVLASVMEVSALGWGASRLSPLFRHALAWRAVDAGVTLIVWGVALSLVWPRVAPLV